MDYQQKYKIRFILVTKKQFLYNSSLQALNSTVNRLIVRTFGLWRLQLSVITGQQTETSNMTKKTSIWSVSVSGSAEWDYFSSCYLCHRVLRSSSVFFKKLYRDFVFFLTVGKATAAPCSTGSPSVTVSLNTVRWKCLSLCLCSSSVRTSAVSVVSGDLKQRSCYNTEKDVLRLVTYRSSTYAETNVFMFRIVHCVLAWDSHT